MGIISRAKLVALPFFTADRIARYMAAGQLTSKQVVKYAVQSDFVMTQKAWKVLNADPSLIVRLECRKGIGLAYFGEDVGR
ncbi:MAG: hypothetical protein KJ732_01110, partial [Candidatus Margulisbacteria bacterium]|nr:hypothetical protein [Candidatus Margulisiibacteriota bacterium]